MMGMYVAARPDSVEADPETWRNVGTLVKDRRGALILKQKQVADAAGISVGVLSQLENARNVSFARPTLRGVSAALGWDQDALERYIVDGTGPVERADFRRPNRATVDGNGERLTRIEESLSALVDEQGRTLREMADLLAEMAPLLRDIAERFGPRR